MRDKQTHGFGADKSKQVYLLQIFTKLKEVQIKHSQSRELKAKATLILEGVNKPWCGLIALYRDEIGFKLNKLKSINNVLQRKSSEDGKSQDSCKVKVISIM